MLRALGKGGIGISIGKHEEELHGRRVGRKDCEDRRYVVAFIGFFCQSQPLRSSYGNRPSIRWGADQDIFQSEKVFLSAKLDLRVMPDREESQIWRKIVPRLWMSF